MTRSFLAAGKRELGFEMNFDQGELDLSGNGSEEGHRKWQQELDEKKRAFEVRYGVILGRRVRVQFSGELNALDGMIYLVSKSEPQASGKLRFRLGNREFTANEIESIIRVDD
jgi:hypothetical protein